MCERLQPFRPSASSIAVVCKIGRKLSKQQQACAYTGHTEKASAAHMEAGGNEWDTVKPLHKWFKHLDRVLLIDDVADKVMQVMLVCMHVAVKVIINKAVHSQHAEGTFTFGSASIQ